jgi:diguanylate cyclase (GGDEF)-like protein
MSSSSAPPPSPTGSFESKRSARPVLIVEDQRSLSEMLSSMLKHKWGCEVLIASSLAEAQAVLQEHGARIFAAVCDVNLPDAPYGEVIDTVGKYRIPAIALTGTISEEIRHMMAQGHIVDYVLKKGVMSYDYVVQWVGRLHRNSATKVLVADDSPTSLQVIKSMLSLQGLQVEVAQNGQEALSKLRTHPDVKLVLVDYNMPLVDGFEFVMEARRMLGKERLAIIGISGENRADISAQFLKHGANDFISKPYSFEEMTCRVNQNLEMLELLESMHNLANRDFLTGLYNRRYFFEQGHLLYQQVRKAKTPLVVAMIDIDHFKTVNDTYGHAYGDQVLKHLSECLLHHFPRTLIARLGGEEFAIFSTEETADTVRQRLEHLRVQLPKQKTSVAPNGVAVTISIGMCYELQGDLPTMLNHADQHLYSAKQKGRNRLEG